MRRRTFLGSAAVAAWARDKGRTLETAYLYDEAAHRAANAAGKNYWDAYLPEMLAELGVSRAPLGPAALGDRARLKQYSTILIGDATLPPRAARALRQWVAEGGTLIAFRTRGLAALCGNRVESTQPEQDAFTYSAQLQLSGTGVSAEIHSVLAPAARLLIFSDTERLRAAGSTEVARLFDAAGNDTGCAGVTHFAIGSGRAFYFAFSLPKTIWVLHQGRPVTEDRDGDHILRRSDALVIGKNTVRVGYADELMFLLANMIGSRPHPFLHQLPPLPETHPHSAKTLIPDALLHWGGDDEASPNLGLTASNWMKQRGLPYHVNALPMPGLKFGMTAEDARAILANGHEVSLHFNMIDAFDLSQGFTAQDIAAQAEGFRQQFGFVPVATVFHWTRWIGWAEPAKWMRASGILADNSFIHAGSPPPNPVNILGFASSTAFPFYFYDDWKSANQRIDFVELPAVAYECGYRNQTETDFPLIHDVVETAVRYHLTLNMFNHPVYIATFPACRQAIEELQRYIAERGYTILHVATDAAALWWRKRQESGFAGAHRTGNRVSVRVNAAHENGAVVKVPLGAARLAAASINGKPAEPRRVREDTRFGQHWALVAVPRGESAVEVEFRNG